MGSLLKMRHLPAAAAVLSVLLALPALGVGWILDDYYHRTVLLGTVAVRETCSAPPRRCSDSSAGTRTGPAGSSTSGSSPGGPTRASRRRFLQALTVLTHRLDYALWPDSPVLMHAHSLFWLGAAVAVTAVFYRRMLGPTWVAGVAALLFAVDDARGATVGFLANRNVLVAATFGVSALIAHDRARRDGSRPAGLLAPLLLLAALFSKEEGIGTCAYLAAYALFVDPRGRWRGGLALWPYAVMVVAWGALRAYWGYGVRDVGLYIDPLTDTGRFLTAAAGRLPILLLGQWSPIPAELATVLRPPISTALWWFAVAFLGVLLFAMAPLLRRDPPARFWAAGMLLAAIPVMRHDPDGSVAHLRRRSARPACSRSSGGSCSPPRRADEPASGASRRRRWRGSSWPFTRSSPRSPFPFRAANPLGPAWVEKRFYVRTPLGSSAGGSDRRHRERTEPRERELPHPSPGAGVDSPCPGTRGSWRRRSPP